MNLKSEQILSNKEVLLDGDQSLSKEESFRQIIIQLGEENCTVQKYGHKKVLMYVDHITNKKTVFLVSSVTYMGGNGVKTLHPAYLKRIQLKNWYKTLVTENPFNADNIVFLGVYHYEGNVVFVNVHKDSYLRRKMNNSAAHIYMNDLYQAMSSGVFTRVDKNNNVITSVKKNEFKMYIDSNLMEKYAINDYQSIISQFNEVILNDEWLVAKDAIISMHEGKWYQRNAGEWAAMYLEYKFYHFLNNNGYQEIISYTGKGGNLDLYFTDEGCYGDLKASDINQKETPANDKETVDNAILRDGRLWYIIYQHQTIKDKDCDYEATRFRTHYIHDKGEWSKKKPFNELSYHNRMKNRVKFENMLVLEINSANIKHVLTVFKQGKQATGEKRKVKYKISKKSMENFVIYRSGK